MNELKFWEIVESAHDQSGGDMDRKCDLVRDAISKLPGREASAFSALFDLKMDSAYSWALWGAAYVINGGCGDDTFSDFRASLISRGRNAFEGAIADPDSLPTDDFDEDTWFYEGYQYAVADGVKAATGSAATRANPHPDKPFGQAWDEEKVYGLYPQLAEKFV